MVNGSTSSWSPVVSAVPQETVSGPNIFLMFISDLPTNITSGIKLFADDCVHSVSNPLALQRDLYQLEKWAPTWQMKFAPTKYVHHFEEFCLFSLVTSFEMRSSTVLATKSTSAST